MAIDEERAPPTVHADWNAAARPAVPVARQSPVATVAADDGGTRMFAPFSLFPPVQLPPKEKEATHTQEKTALLSLGTYPLHSTEDGLFF